MNFFADGFFPVMSPYVSKMEVRIYGMVPVRIPALFYIRSARHLESTSALVLWMMVRLTILQRLNVPIVSFCRSTVSDICNFVALSACTIGPG